MDRRREFAASINRLRTEIEATRRTLSASNCGVLIDGRDVKATFIQYLEGHVRQLDWLSSQITEGLDVTQDLSEEVRSLGDTDHPMERPTERDLTSDTSRPMEN
ncbi:MAG: hypothetical protein AB7E81_20555 [Hyphomicrobiaceae bacterium]